MIFSRVLLPDPLRPMIPTVWPRGNFERGVLHRLKIVKAGLVTKQLGEQLAQGIRALLDNPEALA